MSSSGRTTSLSLRGGALGVKWMLTRRFVCPLIVSLASAFAVPIAHSPLTGSRSSSVSPRASATSLLQELNAVFPLSTMPTHWTRPMRAVTYVLYFSTSLRISDIIRNLSSGEISGPQNAYLTPSFLPYACLILLTIFFSSSDKWARYAGFRLGRGPGPSREFPRLSARSSFPLRYRRTRDLAHHGEDGLPPLAGCRWAPRRRFR